MYFLLLSFTKISINTHLHYLQKFLFTSIPSYFIVFIVTSKFHSFCQLATSSTFQFYNLPFRILFCILAIIDFWESHFPSLQCSWLVLNKHNSIIFSLYDSTSIYTYQKRKRKSNRWHTFIYHSSVEVKTPWCNFFPSLNNWTMAVHWRSKHNPLVISHNLHNTLCFIKDTKFNLKH